MNRRLERRHVPPQLALRRADRQRQALQFLPCICGQPVGAHFAGPHCTGRKLSCDEVGPVQPVAMVGAC